MPQSLKSIIKKCRRQDRQAQAELYQRFVAQLSNAAMRYAPSSASVADIVHDGFIKAFQNIQKFKGNPEQLYAWMLRIIINEALQNYRKSKRAQLYAAAVETTPLDGEAIMLAKMSEAEIWSLIDGMKMDSKIILNLHLVDQLSHQEISDLLSISQSHSRTRLARAKQQLRNLINNQKTLII